MHIPRSDRYVRTRIVGDNYGTAHQTAEDLGGSTRKQSTPSQLLAICNVHPESTFQGSHDFVLYRRMGRVSWTIWGVPNRNPPKILEKRKITTSMNTLEQHRNLRVFCQFRWLLRRFRTQQSEGTISFPLRGVFPFRLVWCGSPFLALAEPGRKHFSGKQTPPHCWPIFSRMHSIYP